MRQSPQVRTVVIIIRVGQLIEEGAYDIAAYFDEPKTLEELRDAVNDPQPGYDVHHLAEQEAARKDVYSARQVQSRENKVRIPRFKHWQINRWYGRRNPDFGGLSPREYLKAKSWEERQRVGLTALREHGVLK